MLVGDKHQINEQVVLYFVIQIHTLTATFGFKLLRLRFSQILALGYIGKKSPKRSEEKITM